MWKGLEKSRPLPYFSREFRESMKLLGIKSEYIQKHTPEDNGDIESFQLED